MAIASMTVSLTIMIDHFADQPSASMLVLLTPSVSALLIALLAPLARQLIDRVGRRRILIAACSLYGFAGIAPVMVDNLIGIIATRLVLGTAEAALITISATLIADY